MYPTLAVRRVGFASTVGVAPYPSENA